MRVAVLGLVLFFLFPGHWRLFAQKPSIKFRHLTTADGLSQSTVTAILKDQQGFMWFGTREGLNRYDGYQFKIYKYDDEVPGSLHANVIRDLALDAKGNILVATEDGFDQFVRKSDTFIHFSVEGPVNDIFKDSKGNIWLGTENGICLFNFSDTTFTRFTEGMSNKSVSKIAEGSDGTLWIGTANGLNQFDPVQKSFTIFGHDPGNSSSVAGNVIKTVLTDRDKRLWIGTLGGGISRFDSNTRKFINYTNSPQEPGSLCHNDVLSMNQNDQGRIWIGTENGGISILDEETKKFYCYTFDADDESTLNNNSVYALYNDDIGNMWIGTYAGGINFVPKYGDKFIHYKHIANTNSLSNNNVLSIGGDSEGNIWIGTDGDGLNIFNPKTKTFKHLKHDPRNSNSPGSDVVFLAFEADEDHMAIAYLKGGFDLYNKRTGKFKHHLPEPGNKNSLSHIHVLTGYRDRSGNLWLGTAGGGLDKYDMKTGQFTNYRNNPDDKSSISDNVIISIYESADGRLWVGTGGGLNVLDQRTNTFRRYVHDSKNKQSLGHNLVLDIHEDAKGNIWVGTSGGGLNRLEKGSDLFTIFTEKDGLPNNTIYGILEDNNGNLWLSTNRGISRFNHEAKSFRNYDASDGVQGNEHKFNAAYKSEDGEMFFGGPNGFSAFYPEQMEDNAAVPSVVITDFEIFNKPVPIGSDKSPLKEHISVTDEIVLSHDQTVLTFRYVALNYTLPEKNQYAYMLEGFDDQWNFVNTRRSVSYTNLDPGSYTFKVKGSNNDGVWNEKGTTLRIVILPPFWKTWWFYTLSAMAAAGAFYLFIKFRLRSVRRDKEVLRKTLQDALDKAHAELEKEKNAVLEEQTKNFERNWIDQSLSAVGEILSKSKNDVEELCAKVLSASIKRCEVVAGAIYLYDEEKGELIKKGNYGFSTVHDSISKGTGLIGECFENRQAMEINNLPENYFNVSSGLGSANPRSLLLIPLQYEEICVGVLELASFNEVPAYRKQYLEKLSFQLAATIHTTQISEKTKNLLDESRMQTEQMRVREEELKQNLEEMQAMQEDYTRKSVEYEHTIQKLQNQIRLSNA